jgi:hypothetical protein
MASLLTNGALALLALPVQARLFVRFMVVFNNNE